MHWLPALLQFASVAVTIVAKDRIMAASSDIYESTHAGSSELHAWPEAACGGSINQGGGRLCLAVSHTRPTLSIVLMCNVCQALL